MGQETYVNFREYLESTAGSVILFILRDVRGHEINRQVVTRDQLGMNDQNSYTAKFVVDELLTAKMVPGDYSLYMYIGVSDLEDPTPDDYILSKCLTEQGVRIRVRGGAYGPSVGVNEDE